MSDYFKFEGIPQASVASLRSSGYGSMSLVTIQPCPWQVMVDERDAGEMLNFRVVLFFYLRVGSERASAGLCVCLIT